MRGREGERELVREERRGRREGGKEEDEGGGVESMACVRINCEERKNENQRRMS